MLYRSMTWPAKGVDVIRLHINDAKRAVWISNIRLEDRISSIELRNILQINIM